MADHTLRVVITAHTAGLASGLAAARSEVSAFGNDVKRLSTDATGASDRLGRGFLVAGGIIAAGFGVAVAAAAKFESEMRNVTTISDYTKDHFEQVSASVLELSTRLPQSANDLASGLYDIASSGFAGADGMKVLEASATAASAGLSTTATAGRAITGVLNAYGLSAGDAKDVSDLLFQTVNLGVVTFDELAQNLGDVVGVAAAAGVDLKQVGAAVATITLAGVPAAEATTSLNRVIQSLLQPSDKLAATFKAWGFESGEAALQSLGLHGVMKKLAGSTDGTATAWLELFPEIRAARGALALTAAEGRNYDRVMQGMNDSSKGAGATQKALAEQSKALGFQLSTAKNEIMAVGIQIGTALLPVLKGGVALLRTFVEGWMALPGPVRSGIAVMAGIAAVALLAAGSFLTIGRRVQSFSQGLKDLGPAGQRVEQGLGWAGKLAAIAGAAFLAADGIRELSSATGDSTKGLVEMGLAGATAGAALGGVQGAAIGAGVGLATGFVTRVLAAGESVEQTRQRLKGLSTELQNLDDKAAATAFLRDFLKNLGVGSALLDGSKVKSFTDELRQLAVVAPSAARAVVRGLSKGNLDEAQLRAYTAAVAEGTKEYQKRAVHGKEAADADAALAQDALKNSGLLDTEAQSAQDAADALGHYKDALAGILGNNLNAAQAAVQFQNAIASLSEEITKNGNTLDLNTKEGRDNQSAFLSAAGAAQQHAEAVYEQTGSVDLANMALASHVTQLVDAATQAGLSGEAALTYTEDLLGIPADRRTEITNSADLARVATELLLAKYKDAEGTRTTKLEAKDNASGVVNGLTGRLQGLVGRTWDVIVNTIERVSTSGGSSHVNRSEANGGVLSFADGAHVAQIAPAGAYRVWAEPETGGESYIPLARSKRKRSLKILGRTAEMFGFGLIPEADRSLKFANGGIVQRFDIGGIIGGAAQDEAYRQALRSGIGGTKSGSSVIALGQFLGFDTDQIQRDLDRLVDGYLDVEKAAGHAAAEQLAASGLIGDAYDNAARAIVQDAEDTARSQEQAARDAAQASEQAARDTAQAQEQAARDAQQAQEEAARAAEQAAQEAQRAAEAAAQAYQQAFDSIADPIRRSGDALAAFGKDVYASFGSIKDYYTQAIQYQQEYASDVAKLSSLGLNATTLKSILQQGPEALNFVRGILEGGADAVKFVNEAQSTIEQIAGTTAGTYATIYGVTAPNGSTTGPSASNPVPVQIVQGAQSVQPTAASYSQSGGAPYSIGDVSFSFPTSSDAPKLTHEDVRTMVTDGLSAAVAKARRGSRR